MEKFALAYITPFQDVVIQTFKKLSLRKCLQISVNGQPD